MFCSPQISSRLSQILEEIEQGNIEQALDSLLDFSRGENWECYKEVVIYKCQYLELKKMSRKGIIRFDDYMNTRSQLIDSFIETLRNVSF